MGTPLLITDIRRDGGTQPRDHVDLDVARSYAEALADGAALPDVVVFYDGTEYWLADGFHRVEAMCLLGADRIEADVRQGSRRDAVLHSVGANAAHGLPRTNADKRRAVLTLVNDEEWGKWSDRAIAKQCSVTHPTVAALRPAREADDGEVVRVYTDRHGTPQTMRVGAIGKPRGTARPMPVVAGREADMRPAKLPVDAVDRLVGIAEASLITGYTKNHLRSFVAKEKLMPAEAHRGQLYFKTDDLRAWMASDALADEQKPRGDDVEIPVMTDDQEASIRTIFDLVRLTQTLPPPSAALSSWSLWRGQTLSIAALTDAANWLARFAKDFPAVEAERAARVNALLEKVAADVAA